MTDSVESDVPAAAPDPLFRERYPWHAQAWSALTHDLARLPHALLLHGAEGLGKRAFAWRLAQSVLCLDPGPEASACGVCASCRRFATGAHPDLLPVRPLEDSRTITIDQVRHTRTFVALKPHTAARKLVMLEPAEAMNLNAVNGLLKVLEEPPASSLLVLITPSIARLPATIRSRCTLVAFRPPARSEAAEWLRTQGVTSEPNALLDAAGGAPLRALALARSSELESCCQLLQDIEALRTGKDDPLRCAARWKNFGTTKSLEWFQRHLAADIRAKVALDTYRKNANGIKALFNYFDVVSEARAVADGPLDQALLLEDIFIRWTRLSRSMV